MREYNSASTLGARGGVTPPAVLKLEVTQNGLIPKTLTVVPVNPAVPGDTDAKINRVVTPDVEVQDPRASADLRIAKTLIGWTTVARGDFLTCDIEVRNFGNPRGDPVNPLDTRVTDSLLSLISDGVEAPGGTIAGVRDRHRLHTGTASGSPSAMNFTSAASGPFGRDLTCRPPTPGTCKPGPDCPVLRASVRTGLDWATRTSSTRIPSQTTTDPIRGNDSDTPTYSQTSCADVTATKTATPATVSAGQNAD